MIEQSSTVPPPSSPPPLLTCVIPLVLGVCVVSAGHRDGRHGRFLGREVQIRQRQFHHVRYGALTNKRAGRQAWAGKRRGRGRRRAMERIAALTPGCLDSMTQSGQGRYRNLWSDYKAACASAGDERRGGGQREARGRSDRSRARSAFTSPCCRVCCALAQGALLRRVRGHHLRDRLRRGGAHVRRQG